MTGLDVLQGDSTEDEVKTDAKNGCKFGNSGIRSPRISGATDVANGATEHGAGKWWTAPHA